MSRGNIDQVGRSAWGDLVELTNDMVLDHVNDARAQYSKARYAKLVKDIEEAEAAANLFRNENLAAEETEAELRLREKDYEVLRVAEEDLKREHDRGIHPGTYPQLCNDAVPNFIYTETYNNRWDLCHGYITTDLNPTEMEKFYELASEDPDNNEIEINHTKRKHAKEAMRTISDIFEQPSYYACSSKSGHTCPLPNTKKTPDCVVTLLPDDPTKYLKIPLFVFEVTGKKVVRGELEKQFPGIVATLQSMAGSPYAYYGEVDGKKVILYHFQKVADEGRIKITQEVFNYSQHNPNDMVSVLGRIVERLTEIFVDIYVNLTWVKMECSRLMKCAEYRNFIAEQDGQHKRGVEMHCWHFFDPTYVGQAKIKDPKEYIPGVDRCDPKIIEEDREPKRTEVVYSIEGDEIVPVVSSDTTHGQLKAIFDEVAKKEGITVLDHKESRAVRDPDDGSRQNRFDSESWDNAFHQFFSNTSLYISNKLNTFGELLERYEFDDYFNPNIKQPKAEFRKAIRAKHPEESVAYDYELTTDEEDDMDALNDLEDLGTRVIPGSPVAPQTPLAFGIPVLGGGDGPASGPTTRKKWTPIPGK